jgi:hypothetical protein
MLALIPSTLVEWALYFGLLASGFFLFVAGNRLFGRDTGGKRLVIFAAGLVASLLGGFIIRALFTMGDASLTEWILGAAFLACGLGLLTVSFASKERVEKIFKSLLGSL